MKLWLVLLLHVTVPDPRAAGFQRMDYHGYSVIHLHPDYNQLPTIEMVLTRKDVDVWSWVNQPDGANIDVMLSPLRSKEVMAIAKANKINFTVVVEDVQQMVDAEHEKALQRFGTLDGQGISFDTYHRYKDILRYVKSLARRFPRMVSQSTIGRTAEGRDLKVVKISTGGHGKRPLIMIDGGIHAREWSAPAMALYVIYQLVENSSNSYLLENMDWHVVPVLNPDGYEFTHTHVRLWRKNRKPTTRRCFGTDLNRNFGISWGTAGTSNRPCDITFGGLSAFSEPETRAYRDHILKNKGRMKLYISFHAYGNLILYPYSFTDVPADDVKDMHLLATRANMAQMAAGGVPFVVGNPAKIMYKASGGSDDWVKRVAGVKYSYTIEIGDNFTLTSEQLPNVLQSLFEGVRTMAEYITSMI